jgi:hypothetical protein
MDTFKKKALALSALPLAFIFGAAFQSSNTVSAQLAAIRSQISGLEFDINSLQSQISSLKPRKFYLTKNPSDGAHALTACAAGYHMASLWEIHDPSNLRYDTELGFTLADSGSGPPFAGGWIRTGWIADVSNNPGTGNCNAWTSNRTSDQGTGVGLSINWSLPSSVISPRQTATTRCDAGLPVWCVQD